MNVFATMGPAYERLKLAFPLWLTITVAVIVACHALLRWLARARRPGVAGTTDRVAGWALGEPTVQRDWGWIVLGSAALILATGWQEFHFGFFRNDDFAFVGDAREPLPFTTYLSLYHADHSLPLYRLEVWTVVRLLGEDATAPDLAAAFNAVGFCTYLALVVSGSWLLLELRVRRMVIGLFTVLAWTFPGWGEFTTGFYTLTCYPQTAVAGFLAVAMLLRSERTGNSWWSAAALGASAVGMALDVSGMWIPPVLLGFAAVSYTRERRLVLAGFALGVALLGILAVIGYSAFDRHEFSARELVQNPRALSVRSSIRQNIRDDGGRMPLMLAQAFGVIVLGSVVPPETAVMERHLTDHPGLTRSIMAVEAGVGAVVVLILACVSARCSWRDRRQAFACCIAVFVLLGMMVAARAHGLHGPALFWPGKYRALPYCWVVLLGCFLLDRAIIVSRPTRRSAVHVVLLTGTAALWLLVPQWYVEKAIDVGAAWLPAGRFSNVEQAKLRRRDLLRFQQDVQRLGELTGQTDIFVPPVTSGYWAYPSLQLGGDPVLGSNYLPTDLLSVAPACRIHLKTVDQNAVPAEVRAAIAHVPGLKLLYSRSPR